MPRFSDGLTFPNSMPALTRFIRDGLGVRCSPTLPRDLAADEPFIRVNRQPGSDDGIQERWVLEAEVLHPSGLTSTTDPLWDITFALRELLANIRGDLINGVLFDSVTTHTTAAELPYPNPSMRRTLSMFRVSVSAQ